MATLVDVRRSGGFAGIPRHSSVPESELGPDDLGAVLELVERFEGARSRAGQPGVGADRFQYDVTISDGEGERHATVWEDELTPEEHALLARLMQHGTR